VETNGISVLMFGLWSLGVVGINIYLTAVITSIKITTKSYMVNFVADIGVSATAGAITYLLAKTLHVPDIYLVMIAAIIGHLSARVAYQSSMLELYHRSDYDCDNSNTHENLEETLDTVSK
jgi:hypothetical protein